MSIDLILTGVLQGLVLGLVAYAVMIPFRLLNFPDLTAEGAYPFGGAVCAALLIMGIHPFFCVLCATILAGIAGVMTGLIHLRLRVNTLLAGIILSTMLYSIDLRVMGRPNIPLFDSALLFGENININIIILFFIILLLILPLGIFLRTEVGLRFRVVGLNQDFAIRHGVCITKYTLCGLFLSSCYSGLSGGLMVQLQSYMDVGMGVGIVMHALAALMIGEKIVGNHTINRQLIAPLVGALIYQQIQGIALSFGLAPSDLKFFTGALVLIVIAIQRKQRYV